MSCEVQINGTMDRIFLDRAINAPSKSDTAYINLNNLYLDIQAGRIILNRYHYNLLNDYLNEAFDYGDSMREWWESEFGKLPRWLDV